MDFDIILSEIGKKLGTTPRSFGFWDKLTWFKQDKPTWDWENDEIKNSVVHWEKVFTEGELAWGYIIQVNKLMFEKSNLNCPGEVLVLAKNTVPFDLESFEATAQALYDLKGNSSLLSEESEQYFAKYLENELTRVYGLKLPESISNGNDLFVSTLFFQRRHIPKRKITCSLLPVLYLEKDPKVVVMVPRKFWTKKLLRLW